MTSRDQRRAWILTKHLVGEVTTTEAAALLGLSERQVWRLRRAFLAACGNSTTSYGDFKAHTQSAQAAAAGAGFGPGWTEEQARAYVTTPHPCDKQTDHDAADDEGREEDDDPDR